MELTREQYLKRKNCIIQCHCWFGSKEFDKVLKKSYDYYTDENLKLTYIFKKLSKSQLNKLTESKI